MHRSVLRNNHSRCICKVVHPSVSFYDVVMSYDLPFYKDIHHTWKRTKTLCSEVTCFYVWFIKFAVLYISSYLRVWFITSMLSHVQLKHRFSRRLMITNMTDIPITEIEKIRKSNNDWYQHKTQQKLQHLFQLV